MARTSFIACDRRNLQGVAGVELRDGQGHRRPLALRGDDAVADLLHDRLQALLLLLHEQRRERLAVPVLGGVLPAGPEEPMMAVSKQILRDSV